MCSLLLRSHMYGCGVVASLASLLRWQAPGSIHERMTRVAKQRLRRAFLCCVTLLSCGAAGAQPTPSPRHLYPVNRIVWNDPELGLRFTYTPDWKVATATQSSTRVVINWRLSKSASLLAACHIEVHKGTALANAPSSSIHAKSDSVAKSLLQSLKVHAPDARLIEARPAIQDGHPVLYVVRQGTVEVFDRKDPSKVYSMVTSWRKNEINFECGTSVFGTEYASLPDGQRLIDQVEAGILNLMRTLQFDRTQD